MNSIPQIVIDTNIVVAAQRSKQGASSKLLSMMGTGRFEAHISVPLAIEYEAVLLRQSNELNLTMHEVNDLVDALCALSMPHDIHFLWRPYLRDAADEHVLEVAVAGQCGYIVTFNRKDFTGADAFGINLIYPGEFLRQLGEIL